MNKLYLTQEELMLAECELTYIANLVSFFEHSQYSKLVTEEFHDLKEFHLIFAHKIERLKSLFETNMPLFSEKKARNILKIIDMDCKKLRLCFHEVHQPFLIMINNVTNQKIQENRTEIKGSIKLAEKSLSCFMASKFDKSNLENLKDYLTCSTRSLTTQLKSIRNDIQQLSISANKDELKDMPVSKLQDSLQLVTSFYSELLTDLHNNIINKVDFSFSKKEQPQSTCNNILKIRTNSNMVRYTSKHTIWNNNDIGERDDRGENIELVMKFIKENVRFFYAPFDKHDKRLFQRWANANADELTEVSDGIKKHLNSPRLQDIFSEALFWLKEDDDADLLREFFLDEERSDFIKFLKDCIDYPYPVIDEWERYYAFH